MKKTRRQMEAMAFKLATDWAKETFKVPLSKIAELLNPEEKAANNRINNIRGARIDLDKWELEAIEAAYPGFMDHYRAALNGEQPGGENPILTSIIEHLDKVAASKGASDQQTIASKEQTIAAQAQTIETLNRRIDDLTQTIAELRKK